MDVFRTAVRTLRESEYPKTQLDILLHKQVLAQVFKVSDIQNWETKVECGVDNELGIAVFFHPAKLFNLDNFERFSKSELYTLSRKVDLGIETYLIFTKSDFTDEEVMNVINNVLSTIYAFSEQEKFEFRVDTYS